jgi:hypothetical protein
MRFPQSSYARRRPASSALPEAIILVLAPCPPLFSHRAWLHAQLLVLGAILAPGARTVTAAWRVMGLATDRRFTNDHRGLNRATWSARQASRMLLGVLSTVLVPAGGTLVLGAHMCPLKPRRVDRRGWSVCVRPLGVVGRGADPSPRGAAAQEDLGRSA